MKVVKKSELVKRNRVNAAARQSSTRSLLFHLIRLFSCAVPSQIQRILTERQILSVANHPFVVTLHYSFQTADYFYLIMQVSWLSSCVGVPPPRH
jgi:hypothetical protein